METINITAMSSMSPYEYKRLHKEATDFASKQEKNALVREYMELLEDFCVIAHKIDSSLPSQQKSLLISQRNECKKKLLSATTKTQMGQIYKQLVANKLDEENT